MFMKQWEGHGLRVKIPQFWVQPCLLLTVTLNSPVPLPGPLFLLLWKDGMELDILQ